MPWPPRLPTRPISQSVPNKGRPPDCLGARAPPLRFRGQATPSTVPWDNAGESPRQPHRGSIEGGGSKPHPGERSAQETSPSSTDGRNGTQLAGGTPHRSALDLPPPKARGHTPLPFNTLWTPAGKALGRLPRRTERDGEAGTQGPLARPRGRRNESDLCRVPCLVRRVLRGMDSSYRALDPSSTAGPNLPRLPSSRAQRRRSRISAVRTASPRGDTRPEAHAASSGCS